MAGPDYLDCRPHHDHWALQSERGVMDGRRPGKDRWLEYPAGELDVDRGNAGPRNHHDRARPRHSPSRAQASAPALDACRFGGSGPFIAGARLCPHGTDSHFVRGGIRRYLCHRDCVRGRRRQPRKRLCQWRRHQHGFGNVSQSAPGVRFRTFRPSRCIRRTWPLLSGARHSVAVYRLSPTYNRCARRA